MRRRLQVVFLSLLSSVAVSCAGGPSAPGAGDQPGGPPGGGAPLAVGDPCTRDAQCPVGGSGVPACLIAGFAGGYCAVEECASHGHDCPNDGVRSQCVLAPTNRCLELCAGDSDCRPGYTCQGKPDSAGHGTVSVCFPQ